MKEAQPRQNSLVRFELGDIDPSWLDRYPFDEDGQYVFLGEIPNMPGHCVVADPKTGKVHSGFHIEKFVEVSEGET